MSQADPWFLLHPFQGLRVGGTLRVDGAYGNDTRGNADPYDSVRPWKTVQAAYAGAAAGDLLLIGPGTYAIGALALDKSMTLRGEGFSTILSGQATISASAEIFAHNLRFENTVDAALVLDGVFPSFVGQDVEIFGIYSSAPANSEALRLQSSGAVTLLGGQVRAFRQVATTGGDVQAIRVTGSVASGAITIVGGNHQASAQSDATDCQFLKDEKTGVLNFRASNCQFDAALFTTPASGDLGLLKSTAAGGLYRFASVSFAPEVTSSSGERVVLATMSAAGVATITNLSLRSDTIPREQMYFADASHASADVYVAPGMCRGTNGVGVLRRLADVGVVKSGEINSVDAKVSNQFTNVPNTVASFLMNVWDATTLAESETGAFVATAAGLEVAAHREGRYQVECTTPYEATGPATPRIVGAQVSLNGAGQDAVSVAALANLANADHNSAGALTNVTLAAGDVVSMIYTQVGTTAGACEILAGTACLRLTQTGA